MTTSSTALYVVPTPIGNMEDITFRAVNILKMVDVILAEDTRKSGVLLKHLKIDKPLQSYHIFNEGKIVSAIVDRLIKGEKMALISDAGTPAISDPGFLLVRTCLEHGVDIECLPGATAFVPALVKSGLPASSFVFEGFLPHKKGRAKKLNQLTDESRTMIFYESPHRLIKTLTQFIDVFGKDRQASVSRELTKIYEETINGTLEELLEIFVERKIKGEFVLVVAGEKGK
ncbi:16S rRNA (cytidine(1402)-2'-O)-methyltransferase [Fulvivirgaceae bacterium BMA12]|uniref:Ribosomal RNA small subunit methyltransferase I n=1 Tax=Agaribacillus aureus TaxID=3051825 RepID=A0ABT8LGY4_9BACT|nr:16S rRNA (cytidine(1402)-2'-O)-methyltransferase [Fulvivirgaceae bacterium BMA12]